MALALVILSLQVRFSANITRSYPRSGTLLPAVWRIGLVFLSGGMLGLPPQPRTRFPPAFKVVIAKLRGRGTLIVH